MQSCHLRWSLLSHAPRSVNAPAQSDISSRLKRSKEAEKEAFPFGGVGGPDSDMVETMQNYVAARSLRYVTNVTCQTGICLVGQPALKPALSRTATRPKLDPQELLEIASRGWNVAPYQEMILKSILF